MAGITAAGAAWGFSPRRIVDEEGWYLVDDDCESLGPVPSWLDASVHLVDANCYALRRHLALATAGLWYRRAPGRDEPRHRTLPLAARGAAAVRRHRPPDGHLPAARPAGRRAGRVFPARQRRNAPPPRRPATLTRGKGATFNSRMW